MQKQKWGGFVLFFVLHLFLSSTPAFAATSLTTDGFLELLERKAFDYFWNETSSATGLVRDRAPNWGSDESRVATIAGVGFALTSYPIAIERGWISKDEGYKRTHRTLRFFQNVLEHQNGFYFHFIDRTMGTRAMESEVSSIDTALFLYGALTAGQYFKGTDIETIANDLYRRTDFKWMLNGGNTLSMGWKPETGFLSMRWNNYDEATLLYLLAIASPTHAIPVESWSKVHRKVGRYGNYTLVQSPPLFTHQFLHLWMGLRNKHDAFMDYFRNSQDATLANRQFCMDQAAKFPGYSSMIWGLTACEGPRGYRAYGAPPGFALHDGTVSPYAVAGSIVFTPKESIDALKYMYDNYKTYLWGKYGFSDAVCVKPFWRSKYCYAINMGTLLLAIENYRTGFVWKLTQQQAQLQKALQAVGFVEGTKEVALEPVPEFRVPSQEPSAENVQTSSAPYAFSDNQLEFGEISSPADLSGQMSTSWNSESLNFDFNIKDQDIIMHRGARALFKDDCVEVFVDTNGDGFSWKDPKDFQFIISPRAENKVRTWESVREADPLESKWIQVQSESRTDGYSVKLKIFWSALGIQPVSGQRLRLSVALHDADRFKTKETDIAHPDEKETKLNTFFQNNGREGKNELAVFVLG